MTTDVDVQYFSHLNGLVLGNDWGDLIRLLDTCLVNGLPLTSITSASIDAQGDITLNLYAAHKCMLFQIIELTGFTPSELNGKYRIKGTPTANQLILKANHIGKSITTTGTAKLAPLGYDIIFRDTNDVKRVYRAKNPTSQHPFIRVDESLTSPDGTTGVYKSSYAKYAMVGLLEHMEHIDDYENPDVLQLPFDPADPEKNWEIKGVGENVVRGWSKWYWAMRNGGWNTSPEVTQPENGNRLFTLCGDSHAFYLLNRTSLSDDSKFLNGCGLFNSSLDANLIPNWFVMAFENSVSAWVSTNRPSAKTGSPLLMNSGSKPPSEFILPRYSLNERFLSHVYATPITPNGNSGVNDLYSASHVPALEIPISDNFKYLRGTLKHVFYSGKKETPVATTPIASGASMYLSDRAAHSLSSDAMFYFYLGELSETLWI